ncbi:MAG: response regulator [Candidatus Heimdallarchaeota archaeon]|nr:response regulator [Candidatus Heimdallarchaeota archaeon]MCK4876016.1 response regulator [Candidatus Heimdallarchaeota archaeon]
MKRIYIIEDEKDISNLYKLLFEREGIEVESIVSSGKVALEEIELIKEELHDIVFLIDNRIPEKSGLDVALRLIEISPLLKNQIIIASADDTITKDQVRDLGILHFLRKPFSLEDLLNTIDTIEKSDENLDVVT